MPDWLLQLVVTAAVTGAVTWGVLRTELKYLRRDVDRANRTVDAHVAEPHERRNRDYRRVEYLTD